MARLSVFGLLASGMAVGASGFATVSGVGPTCSAGRGAVPATHEPVASSATPWQPYIARREETKATGPRMAHVHLADEVVTEEGHEPVAVNVITEEGLVTKEWKLGGQHGLERRLSSLGARGLQAIDDPEGPLVEEFNELEGGRAYTLVYARGSVLPVVTPAEARKGPKTVRVVLSGGRKRQVEVEWELSGQAALDKKLARFGAGGLVLMMSVKAERVATEAGEPLPGKVEDFAKLEAGRAYTLSYDETPAGADEGWTLGAEMEGLLEALAAPPLELQGLRFTDARLPSRNFHLKRRDEFDVLQSDTDVVLVLTEGVAREEDVDAAAQTLEKFLVWETDPEDPRGVHALLAAQVFPPDLVQRARKKGVHPAARLAGRGLVLL